MRTAVLLACLLLAGAVVPAGVVGAAADSPRPSVRTTAAQDDIVRHLTLHLTPEEPGVVRATVTYDIPDAVTALRVYPRGNEELVSKAGFTREDGHLEWDGETATPTLVFRVPVNESIAGRRSLASAAAVTGTTTTTAATATTGGYSFVDTGDWAIAPVPQFRTEWRWVGSGTVTLVRRASVDGTGATGGGIAYLGPYREYAASGHGQHFRLVVPRAASMTERPQEVLSALVHASGMLRVGARDPAVFFVAAPTSVNWGPAGLQYGESDAWVVADAKLSTASNVWFHEYVHTRQAFRTTRETRWTVEGIAEYYAAFLTLRQDRIEFDAFAGLLRQGSQEPYAHDVLSEPSTWSPGTPYYKGALVFGGIDRRIRLATDARYTAADVFARMNRDTGQVTASEFYGFVEAVGGSAVRDYAVRYTQTEAAPEMWTYAEHRRAFGDTPPRIDYGNATYRLTGEYRNRTYQTLPTPVVGETLHVTTTVENTGGTTGEYEVTLARNGTVVSRVEGTLEPGASTTVTLNHTFDATGEFTLWFGHRSKTTFAVLKPVSPSVADLSVDRTTAAPGQAVELVATIRNPGDRPARGTYAVEVAGETVATWTVTLAPAESTTRRTTVSFPEPGRYVVRVGNQSVAVTVSERTEQNGATAAPVSAPTPGFGVVAAATALAAVALLGRRRT